jgi:hypothetical protein
MMMMIVVINDDDGDDNAECLYTYSQQAGPNAHSSSGL